MTRARPVKTLRIAAFALALLVAVLVSVGRYAGRDTASVESTQTPAAEAADAREALEQLSAITIQGRAPKTGYSRDLFGKGWGTLRGCDLRNVVLARDMTDVVFREGTRNCVVERGTLHDQYTGRTVQFVKGNKTSSLVQVDHRVPAFWSWQHGAQGWSADQMRSFFNDPANLVAVEGSVNQSKGASGPGSWLPPSKINRCAYVAGFIHIVWKYQLTMNPGDYRAAEAVLRRC